MEVDDAELNPNVDFIKLQLKALLARNLYDASDYFEVMSLMDKEIMTAMEVISNNKTYSKYVNNSK